MRARCDRALDALVVPAFIAARVELVLELVAGNETDAQRGEEGFGALQLLGLEPSPLAELDHHGKLRVEVLAQVLQFARRGRSWEEVGRKLEQHRAHPFLRVHHQHQLPASSSSGTGGWTTAMKAAHAHG